MSDAEEEYDYLLTPPKQRMHVGKLPESQILTSGEGLTPTSKRIAYLRQVDIVKLKTIQDIDNVIYFNDNVSAIHLK